MSEGKKYWSVNFKDVLTIWSILLACFFSLKCFQLFLGSPFVAWRRLKRVKLHLVFFCPFFILFSPIFFGIQLIFVWLFVLENGVKHAHRKSKKNTIFFVFWTLLRSFLYGILGQFCVFFPVFFLSYAIFSACNWPFWPFQLFFEKHLKFTTILKRIFVMNH